MLFVDGLVTLALLGLWVYVLMCIVVADKAAIRRLPKWAWFVVVLISTPLLGSAAWWLLGRPVGPQPPRPTRRSRRPSPDPGVSPDDNRTRAAAASPDDNEAFLAGLRKRAEEQRRANGGEPPLPA